MYNYSNFITRHIVNDNFLSIFYSYYPDKLINKQRIINVIKKYIYDIDPSTHNISLDQNISYLKTINKLSRKFASTYIMDKFIDNNDLNKINNINNELVNWLDLSNNIKYKSIREHTYDTYIYYKFCKIMEKENYYYEDINSDIRIWKHRYHNTNDIKFVIMTYDDIIGCNIDDINKIYIDIKSFTLRDQLYDIITFDAFNNYKNIDDITRDLNYIFNDYSDFKISIYADNVATIIIPFIVNYYSENLENIYMTDPICYPYSYHKFYISLFNEQTNSRLLEFYKYSKNFIYMFHKLRLIDMYFDSYMTNKQQNIMYGKNVHIHFTNDTNLAILLRLYSKIHVV